MQNLTDAEFQNVTLGSVLFDPASGLKYQKIDEIHRGRNIYGSEYNARGESGSKQFNSTDIVKVHESKIKE